MAGEFPIVGWGKDCSPFHSTAFSSFAIPLLVFCEKKNPTNPTLINSIITMKICNAFYVVFIRVAHKCF